jgi:cytochrome c-type biogenesis protein CcmH/NrfF
MYGEYINMGLMLLIVGATIWILRSPKKKEDERSETPSHEHEKENRP